ncbi:MAG: acetyl-CoA carboxylase carboxyl transferase subunit beta [Chloroflexi bacterium]|nr:acetyl-CoA carboxylase carboxyl transferase subunit beta [Chloroflexota bacterium]
MMKNLVDLLAYFSGHRRGEEEEQLKNCLFCGADLSTSEEYSQYRICPQCNFSFSLSARQRIDLLIDPGSFKETNRFLVSLDPLSFAERISYRKRLFEAQRRTGLSDAVLTGMARIEGHQVVIAAVDFGFLGGSMGCVVGEKMALTFELAIKKKLPLIVVVASGGVRVQEGVLSLMQMAKTAAAAQRLHAAGLPFISVFANPTTGGVYASFANLGDIILAEPRALVGFAPLRVMEKMVGKPLPEGAHSAESHLRLGLVDAIVPRPRLREVLSRLLNLFSSPYHLIPKQKEGRYMPPERPGESAWQAVQLARHPRRPIAWDYITHICTYFVELRGDRVSGDDEAIICGVGDLSGQGVVFVGQVWGQGEREGRILPQGFRKAQRAMKLAAKFRLPLVTFIDTPGAYPGLEAEEGGLGHAIATSLALMSNLPVPIISVIIGEGGSEGALALGVADRILIQENAIYSVISPEGAAAVLYRDATKAEAVAPALKLTAHDCHQLGVVDTIIPEPQGGAHTDPAEAARLIRDYLLQELVEVQAIPVTKLIKARYDKFRRMGEYNSYFGAAMAREVAQLQDYLSRGVGVLKEFWPYRAKSSSKEDEASGSLP